MISCDQHDYIEIACMFRYRIRLILKNGAEVDGVALDTQSNDVREECLLLDIEGDKQLLPLDSVAEIKACFQNPHFSSIRFS